MTIDAELRLVAALKRFKLRHKLARPQLLKISAIRAVVESTSLNRPYQHAFLGRVNFRGNAEAKQLFETSTPLTRRRRVNADRFSCALTEFKRSTETRIE